MISAFLNCFKIEELRRRILFTLLLIVIVRLGAAIPCPGIDARVLTEFFRVTIDQQKQGSVLGMLNLFTGGALENCAIFTLGIMPYISASIVMQLATGVIPSLGRIAREEGGRQKISQYTRVGTLILCIVQGYMYALSFENPSRIPLLQGIEEVIARMGPLVPAPGLTFQFITVFSLTAGTMLLMWIGEQITEKGIGNGISLIVSIGILAKLPGALLSGWNHFVPPSATTEAFNQGNLVVMVLMIAFLFAVVAGTIMITQAMRKVNVQYAKVVRGNKVYGGQSSYLPLKVNYSGVMPVIFASAILYFPMSILGFIPRTGDGWFASIYTFVEMLSYGWFHYVATALMIFFFSYFWVAMIFNPTQIADDMKRNGGFIPGVRPGEPTASFLEFSMTRLTFGGAVFLTALAVLPSFLNALMKLPMITASFFGGTSLLIVVGVMLDTMRQAETYLLQRHYDGFLKKGRLRSRTVGGAPVTGTALTEKQMLGLGAVVAIIIICGIVAYMRHLIQ